MKVKETTHTPRPWRLLSPRANGEIPVIGPHRLIIASVIDSGPEGEAQANARLIMTAPELLDALSVLHTTSGKYLSCPDSSFYLHALNRAREAALALIGRFA